LFLPLLLEWLIDFSLPLLPRLCSLPPFPSFGSSKTVGLLSTVFSSLLSSSKLMKNSTQRWTCSLIDPKLDSTWRTTRFSISSLNKRNSKLLLLLLTRIYENNGRKNMRVLSRLSRSSSANKRTCELMKEKKTPLDIKPSTMLRRGPSTPSMTA